jgi:hypothetical protein
VLLVLAFALGIFGGDDGSGGDNGDNGSGDGTFSSIDPALTGNWDIISAFENSGDGATVDWTAVVKKDSTYDASVIFRDAGVFLVHNNDARSGTLRFDPDTAPEGHVRASNWHQNGNVITWNTYSILPSSMTSLISFSAPNALGNLGVEEAWSRSSGGSGFDGVYEHELKYANSAWDVRLEIKGGRYTFEARLEDKGNFYTEGGQWRQVSPASGLLQGDFQVVDQSTVIFRQQEQLTIFGPTAQVTWKRLPNQ